MLETLKHIESDMGTMKAALDGVKTGLIHVQRDIHSLSGRVLAIERSNREIDQRLQRIEKRLDLVEA